MGRILLACEESQAVCIEFRKRGHEAYSCDIQKSSGGHPEWHICGDVLEVIEQGWDMMIGFPPCTHLAVSGAAWFEQKRKDGRQQSGVDFFMALINAPIEKIAIENPVCIMSSIYQPPTQIIQPYYFGDEDQKTTCLWLKNLPPLQHYEFDDLFGNKKTHVEPKMITSKTGKQYTRIHAMGGGHSKERSKTFPGIAREMANQWSDDEDKN